MKYSAVIVAAGSGTRMKLGYNKVYYRMQDGKTILEHTLSVFQQDPDCAQILVVTDPQAYLDQIGENGILVVPGGETRQASVGNGLANVTEAYVLIHDGARPYVTSAMLQRIKEAVVKNRAVCAMVDVKDTIKVVKDGWITETPDRSTLKAAQTPQAFETALLKTCLQKANSEGYCGTDDCSLVERYGNCKIAVVDGDYANLKITTPEDLK